MSAPAYLVREAALKALQADVEQADVLPLQDAIDAAAVELLLFVEQLDQAVTPVCPDRRTSALWMAAQLMRSRRTVEDWLL